MNDNIYRELGKLLDNKEQAVLITIVKTEGSVPNKIGAKMLLRQDGKTVGTVGGGNPEAMALKEGKKLFDTREAATVTFDLTPDRPESIGSICGGKVTFYMEPVNFFQKIIIFGGGHVAFEVYRAGKVLDFNVTIVDDRPEFANSERFPQADRIICSEFAESVNNINFDNDTYVVILTKGHIHDEVVLRGILQSEIEPAYIGMIGSRRKVKVLCQNLISEGFKEDKINKIYAPIGLDIGGNSPAEIAVSIMGEILKVKYGKTGVSLKDI